MFMNRNQGTAEGSRNSHLVLSEPVTFVFFESGTDFVPVNQLTPFGSSVALFDFGANFGQPFLVFVKQLQRPLDYFAGIVINASAQHLCDQLLVLRPGGDRHSGFSWLIAYRGSSRRVKANARSTTGRLDLNAGSAAVGVHHLKRSI